MSRDKVIVLDIRAALVSQHQVGWGERSEPQHIGALLGFGASASTQPTDDLCKKFLEHRTSVSPQVD